jgi:two-component system OmpR family response regulator
MRILVVEDNEALARGLTKVLKGSGYAVDRVGDGVSANAVTATQRYDLVVLDLTLPEMDGLDVLRSMRGRHDDTPVLVLTARGALDERVRGLNLGADDYLAKPFEVNELEARIRVLLRRRAGLGSSIAEYGPLALDLNTRLLSCFGKTVELPARELSVLETLMLASGRVVSKQQIIGSLSAFDEDVSDNAIEQYVSRLRKKLTQTGVTIRVARGIGYYLQHGGAA